MTQIVLVGLERVTRAVRYRSSIFASGFVALIVLLQTFSGRGAIGWLTLIMLNPDTAWYPKAQIDYSMDDIQRHPLFGLGRETWTRPPWVSESIDDHFLAMALRNGLPALIFFVLWIFLLWRSLMKINRENSQMGSSNSDAAGA